LLAWVKNSGTRAIDHETDPLLDRYVRGTKTLRKVSADIVAAEAPVVDMIGDDPAPASGAENT
jgi:hypothetical protein